MSTLSTFHITAVYVGALALAGAIIVLGRFVGKAVLPPVVVGYARTLFPLLLIVLVVRSFIVEPFRIPSASMMPGLVDGDYILVDKFSYGLKLPLSNTEILRIGAPRRGDVVVFGLPSDPSTHYIKRRVGLPGDHVVVHDNRLYINGQPVPLTNAGQFRGGFGFAGSPLGVERFGAERHVVMFAEDRPAKDFDAIVPAGQFFFMGDNRNDSQDSRFAAVGFVPFKNLTGRATRIWMNWRFPGWPDWRRIGAKIN
jgi:signal peptidase I